MSAHLTDPTHFVRNQPASSVAAVQKLIRDRAARLVAELEPVAGGDGG